MDGDAQRDYLTGILVRCKLDEQAILLMLLLLKTDEHEKKMIYWLEEQTSIPTENQLFMKALKISGVLDRNNENS